MFLYSGRSNEWSLKNIKITFQPRKGRWFKLYYEKCSGSRQCANVESRSKDITVWQKQGKCENHRMNPGIEIQACNAEELVIKISRKPSVIWKGKIEKDKAQCVAGLLRLYLDKSQKFLSRSSFVIYPLHITLLNITEIMSPKKVASGLSVVVYLPVGYPEPEKAPN